RFVSHVFLFLYYYCHLHSLLSSPTRRSSDLKPSESNVYLLASWCILELEQGTPKFSRAYSPNSVSCCNSRQQSWVVWPICPPLRSEERRVGKECRIG